MQPFSQHNSLHSFITATFISLHILIYILLTSLIEYVSRNPNLVFLFPPHYHHSLHWSKTTKIKKSVILKRQKHNDLPSIYCYYKLDVVLNYTDRSASHTEPPCLNDTEIRCTALDAWAAKNSTFPPDSCMK